MLSDEALGRIAYQGRVFDSAAMAKHWDDLSEVQRRVFIRIARAVATALAPTGGE